MFLGIKRKTAYYLVNRVFCGTSSRHWEKKRKLLNWIGHDIGEGTKIAGPVELYGTLHTGKNVWLGTGFKIHGLGHVYIGDNCDIAPEVICLTGSHEIGGASRRAGAGITSDIRIGDGCWICGRSTIIGGNTVGSSTVVAAGAMVASNIPRNVLAGGVPAKMIRRLENTDE